MHPRPVVPGIHHFCHHHSRSSMNATNSFVNYPDQIHDYWGHPRSVPVWMTLTSLSGTDGLLNTSMRTSFARCWKLVDASLLSAMESTCASMCLTPILIANRKLAKKASYSALLFVLLKSRRMAYVNSCLSWLTSLSLAPAPSSLDAPSVYNNHGSSICLFSAFSSALHSLSLSSGTSVMKSAKTWPLIDGRGLKTTL
ncbi:hypothetical protein Hanom_Chr04g00383121 [Helianthus anomalus]